MVINSNDNKPPEPALIGKKTPAQLLFQKAQCPGSILFMPLFRV